MEKLKMSSVLVLLLFMVGSTFAADSITFFEHDNFLGRSYKYTCGFIPAFQVHDVASSVIVEGSSSWIVYEHDFYGGARVTLAPGRYPHPHYLPGNDRVSSCRRVGASSFNKLRLYEHENFRGRFVDIVCSVPNLRSFSDKASSARVYGGRKFTLYEHGNYGGARVTLGPGSYPSPVYLPGGNDKVSSVRAN